MRITSAFVILFAFLFISCKSPLHVIRENINPESFKRYDEPQLQELKKQSPFLKAHMKNGNLYVFDSWAIDDTKSTISGSATLYNSYREQISKGQFVIGLDSVALLETNILVESKSAKAITILAGISTAVTIFCITNPKICFGSCPTFYVSDGDSLRLQAEGFSSSIAPSLEATDIDALYYARPVNGEIIVEMKNEALETHVVRYVNILAVPTTEGNRVFKGQDGQFWQTTRLLPPVSTTCPEGDCLPQIFKADGIERFSLADSSYLGTKEEILFEFDVLPGKSYGLVIGCRQSLLPTYLFYQVLAYMGSEAGYWLAELERKKLGDKHGEIEKIIGGIEVLEYSSGKNWRKIGYIKEHGPIATDFHLIPLGNISTAKLRLKLRMTKGTWRIDYVALAELGKTSTPIRLHPYVVLRNGQEDYNARSILLDSTQVLVTLPGDSYILKYKLPDDSSHFEFFLESRGYYLEWIRKEWIEEENPFLLAEMFLAPKRALRRLAPEFKRVEPELENYFWRSRYAKP